ncbi:MAG: hypothetical protein HKP00_10190, partial [Flavobacteriaceae bacterium]|nr:hypothetical protein [Flavobacteriaceae bacterium]
MCPIKDVVAIAIVAIAGGNDTGNGQERAGIELVIGIAQLKSTERRTRAIK